MQLEDYFDFLAPEEIRIKGHRINMEDILWEYIHRRKTAEQIARRFPTLTLEEVYAALLYYHRNKAAMDAYMEAWIEHGRRMRAEQAKRKDPVMERLRALRAARRNLEPAKP